MSALSADHRRIFAGFQARIAARSSGDGFFSIGTAAYALFSKQEIVIILLTSGKNDVTS